MEERAVAERPMKWKPSQSAVENAGAKLPKLAEKYFKAGRKAAEKNNTPHQLHRFRLKTKRFRYALELFSPIYGPTLERHLAALRGIQDALGKVSDYHTIEEMIAGDKKLEAKLKKARNRKMKEFRDEWEKFDNNGQLQRWKRYLSGSRAHKKQSSRPAKQPKKTVQPAPSNS